MKRMFLLFGLLAMVGVLFVACSDREAVAPTEPSLKKVANGCTGDLKDQLDAIDLEIDDVLMRRPSKKGAHQIVDNIARKVCASPPRYDATPSMVKGFYDLLLDQPVEKLVGGWSAAAALLSHVAQFATGDEFLDIPEGALAPEGGLGVAVPGVATTILTNNMEAAVVADPNSFDGTEPALISLVRLPDPEFRTGNFYGLPAFAEAYDINSTRQPSAAGDGVLIALCVVDWIGPPPTRAIAHDLGEGFEILVPVDLFSVAEDGVVDCDDAGPYEGEGEAVAAEGGPWYGGLAQAIKPVFEQVLSVKPLHAMYFAGRGLGGRTKSFSEFVPVDPEIYVDDELLLTIGTEADWSSDNEAVATVITTEDGDGLVTGQAPGTANITADFGVEESRSLEITVLGSTTIDFDFAPNGTPVASGTAVTNVYAPLGVTFGHGGTGTTCGTTVYANDAPAVGFTIPSAPNRVTLCPDGIQTDISENTFGFIVASLSPTVSQVCVVVQTLAGHSGFLRAFSETGVLLDSNTTPIDEVDSTQTLCVESFEQDIAAATFSGDGSLFARFDDFYFDSGPLEIPQ